MCTKKTFWKISSERKHKNSNFCVGLLQFPIQNVRKRAFLRSFEEFVDLLKRNIAGAF
jgi:hypothetical protein